MAVTPLLSRVDRWPLPMRSGVLLPGFLKPPLIAGGIHDAGRTTPRQGRRDIREFKRADENKQRCGQFSVTFHGLSIARSRGVPARGFVGTIAGPFHDRSAQTIHTNAIAWGERPWNG